MTSPMLRSVVDRINEERHRRRSNGRELGSVSLAPMVYDAFEEEMLELPENVNSDADGVEMVISGVSVERDDDLSVMEFEQ